VSAAEARVDRARRVETREAIVLAAFVLALVALWSAHYLGLDAGWRGITPVFGGMTFIVILAGVGALLWFLGVREQTVHYDNLRRVPIRVHVNGIRGKSTVTRLIGGVLHEGGYRVLTKTTGKAARIIRDDGTEERIERKGRPTIREQLTVLDMAVEEGMDAVVIECMAVEPELQRVAEHKLMQSTIGVITNVRADHLDVMGPTIDDVARNLSGTVPADAVLVTADERFLPVFEAVARKLGTRVVRADPGEVGDDVLGRFSYLNFKDNVAIALEVGRLLDIPDDVAIRGMLKVAPDPGLMTIRRTRVAGVELTFINAMGVNDRDSTILVHRELAKRGYFKDKAVVGFFHARGDRISRTEDFGRAMVKDMSFSKIVVVGAMTKLFVIEAGKAGYDIDLIEDIGYGTGRDAMEALAGIATENRAIGLDTVVFGFGNMVGQIPTDVLGIVDEGAVSPVDTGGGG
jgi:poly-gamma-glutamate synthase PgsB/CapB